MEQETYVRALSTLTKKVIYHCCSLSHLGGLSWSPWANAIQIGRASSGRAWPSQACSSERTNVRSLLHLQSSPEWYRSQLGLHLTPLYWYWLGQTLGARERRFIRDWQAYLQAVSKIMRMKYVCHYHYFSPDRHAANAILFSRRGYPRQGDQYSLCTLAAILPAGFNVLDIEAQRRDIRA